MPAKPVRGCSGATATAGSPHAIITANELIITFGWMAGAFNKKVLFETALSESPEETTVLKNRQHSSQQNFFDLLIELKFRAIFLFAMGVMYQGHFPFCNGRNVPWPFPFLQWA
jgi:hypothetical protein